MNRRLASRRQSETLWTFGHALASSVLTAVLAVVFSPGHCHAAVQDLQPVINYSAFATSTEPVYGTLLSIAADAAGNAYTFGPIAVTDAPALKPLEGATCNGAFLNKVNPAGTVLIYSICLPTGGQLAVDAGGNVYLMGYGASPNFRPVGVARTYCSGRGVYLTKVNPSGSAVVYSTCIGGSGYDRGNSFAVDAAGNAYITGTTDSADFPTTPGALRPALRSSPSCTQYECTDAFVVKFDASGNLAYSTYLGGDKRDEGFGIATDAAGNAYVAGHSESPDFPTTPGAFRTSACEPSYCWDGFVAKLGPTGSLIYSTFLGGGANAVAVDQAGNSYAAASGVIKLDPAGASRVYSIKLGGSSGASAHAIAVDLQGNVYVAGATSSRDFPTIRPIQAVSGDTGGLCYGPPSPYSSNSGSVCYDGFVAKLDGVGSLIYSTYLGGSERESVETLSINAAGNAYIAGTWWSTSRFPLQPSQYTRPYRQAFVAKISQMAGNSPRIASITNGASFLSGAAPGIIATIFGTGLTTVNGIAQASGLPLPTEIAGTSVKLGDTKLPLFAVANVSGQEQINFQMPFTSAPAFLTVTNGQASSAPVFFPWLPDVHPGIFIVDAATPAILHAADWRLVTAANPAVKGEAVVIYATGLGDVKNRPALGSPASDSPLSTTVFGPQVTVGGVAAQVLFSGLAPGFVALNQVNIRIPDTVPSGNLDLMMQLHYLYGGNVASNTVKLPVQ